MILHRANMWIPDKTGTKQTKITAMNDKVLDFLERHG